MKTMRERAEEIGSICSHETGFITHIQLVDKIESHLREACEEAVKEDRERYARENSVKQFPTLSHPTWPYVEHTSPRPTAEDALKRVVALESNVAVQRDLDGVAFRETRQLAEDALKAVRELSALLSQEPDLTHGNPRDGSGSGAYGGIEKGCADLLAGHRDTGAAINITGDDPKNVQEKSLCRS